MSQAAPQSDASEPVILDCLKTIGLDGTLKAMEADGQCLMEIDDFSVVAGKPWVVLWPEESRALVLEAVRRAANGQVARFSADCPTAKGTPKSWDVSVAPVRDESGRIVALQSLSHDVTRRERELREANTVSRELAHRIKNLFAVIDSLIHLSARHQASPLPFVENLRERVRGLARAIAYIHPSEPVSVQEAGLSTQGLITAVVAPYREAGARISLEGDDAEIGQQAIPSLAMVLNELATNAVKYGALKDSDGALSIRLVRTGEVVELFWEEKGMTLVSDGMKPGFGTSLIDRTIRFHLAGSIERDWSSGGLAVRLRIPLARLSDT